MTVSSWEICRGWSSQMHPNTKIRWQNVNVVKTKAIQYPLFCTKGTYCPMRCLEASSNVLVSGSTEFKSQCLPKKGLFGDTEGYIGASLKRLLLSDVKEFSHFGYMLSYAVTALLSITIIALPSMKFHLFSKVSNFF